MVACAQLPWVAGTKRATLPATKGCSPWKRISAGSAWITWMLVAGSASFWGSSEMRRRMCGGGNGGAPGGGGEGEGGGGDG